MFIPTLKKLTFLYHKMYKMKQLKFIKSLAKSLCLFVHHLTEYWESGS